MVPTEKKRMFSTCKYQLTGSILEWLSLPPIHWNNASQFYGILGCSLLFPFLQHHLDSEKQTKKKRSILSEMSLIFEVAREKTVLLARSILSEMSLIFEVAREKTVLVASQLF